jgi:hypothetical protein
MNSTSSNPTAFRTDVEGLERKLVQAWRRRRLFVDLRGAFRVVSWAAVLLVIAFFVDWGLNLSAAGRLALVTVGTAAIVATVYYHWLRHVTRYDPLTTALEVETHHPGLNSLLVSYVQFRDRSGRDANTSPALVGAMVNQAAAVAAPLDFGAIVDFRMLRTLVMLASGILVAVGWSCWQNREMVAVFLARMTHPSSTLRYPTKTQLEAVTREAVVQEGRTFTPSVLAGGVVPREALLTIRPVEGDAETVVVAAGGDEREDGRQAFAYPMGEVYRSFTYTFRVGDAVSDPATVTVVPPPTTKAAVTVTYPAYTGRQPLIKESLTVEVLEGSQVEWSLGFDRPLAAAEMVLDSDRLLPLALQDGGRRALLRLGGDAEPLVKGFQYRFRLEDGEHGFSYAPAAQYALQVVTDRSPRVALAMPSRDLTSTRQRVVDLVAKASDDYGLTSAQIVYSVSNESAAGKGGIPETWLPIQTDALAANPREATLSFKWPLLESVPDLAPGDVVLFAVAVTDNKPGKPSTTLSDLRRITIVTPADYVNYVARQRARVLRPPRAWRRSWRRSTPKWGRNMNDQGSDENVSGSR